MKTWEANIIENPRFYDAEYLLHVLVCGLRMMGIHNL